MADNGELGLSFVTALVACNRMGLPDPARVIVSRDVRGAPPLGNCYGLTDDERLAKGQLSAETLKTE